MGTTHSRTRRLAARILAGATLALVGTFALGINLPSAVRADPPTTQAAGDSYLAGGFVTLLPAAGSQPIQVGPVEPASAYVPSPQGTTIQAVANCGDTANPACVDPVIQNAQAVFDSASATLTNTPTTNCEPGALLPAGFVTGKLTGANACSNAANVGVLSGPLAPLQINAGVVHSQALTQSCTATPTGSSVIANLNIANQSVTIPVNAPPNTILPVLPGLNLVTIIINEQHFDSKGHGITVNAVHIIIAPGASLLSTIGAANADVIIGHAHSEAICPGAPDTGPGNAGNSSGPLPVGTKTDGQAVVVAGNQQTYTMSVKHNGCSITVITDTLPPGFTYVAGSAKGNFGSTTAPTVSVAPVTGQTTLTWTSNTGLPDTPDPLTATITVNVAANLAPGDYVNNVNTLGTCGQTNFSDVPGTLVVAAATPSPTLSAAAASATVSNTPNTSAAQGASVAPIAGLAVLLLGGGAVLIGRRRRIG
jgi:uncharacterized repeat protein (TIGR01451 family)/LPXTG-motif cell wall-anchored protein